MRTLAEMYELDQQYSITPNPKLHCDEAVQRALWLLGANAVVLNLLAFVQNGRPETDPDDPVARVLEGWDAEILTGAVAAAMAAEAARRPTPPDGPAPDSPD